MLAAMKLWALLLGSVFIICRSDSESGSNSSFFLRVNQTLDRVRDSCMHSWLYENPTVPIKFPGQYVFPADAEEHFEQINYIAKHFRSIPIHKYSNYSGPWIENIWIQRFGKRPLQDFSGMVPLFFNWVDALLVDRMPEMEKALSSVLRPNVLYVTVSQSAEGLDQFSLLHPNVLVLSCGGFGHIPLPLLKRPEKWMATPEHYQNDLTFVGSSREERTALLVKAITTSIAQGLRAKSYGSTKLWRSVIYGSMFNLAPRGYGRTSFRLAEIVQMGRIPVYLYNDQAWVPFLGTNMSVADLGLVANFNQIENLILYLKSLLADDMAAAKLHARLDEMRPLFTYDGVMGQIELFFRDPLVAGYLRCVPFPRTVVCCS